ncbi:MAG: glycogen debranching protein GlgX [Lachnospiraceae bacterium]|nr:glycogen debranching protein GlgX [Lachnospiraceae bacterium]
MSEKLSKEELRKALVQEIASENDRAVVTAVPNYDRVHMRPMDEIGGFKIRPGFYEINGATAIPCGVNFTIYSNQATSVELLLFRRGEDEPYAILKFPDNYRIGNVYSMIVFDIDIDSFEYAYRMDGPYNPKKGLVFDKTKVLLDPYAKVVAGQREWGNRANRIYKARVVKNNFDWGKDGSLLTPMEDLIIYEMHVRGFTKDASSGVKEGHNGTFAGVRDKIPYLKELGINAIEFMPVFEFDEMLGRRDYQGRQLFDYWGYNTVCFFAPNTSYTSVIEWNKEGGELKELIRELHNNGIEVFLDVVFNHTAEGNEKGPYISFKGIDNNIYYMLTPDGYYYNFSGCGNTLNCNHPIVQKMIRDCLRYWVTNYHVDGFRFDLATILGRNEDGSPMSKPPLLQSLAFDPILGQVKLIAEAWDAGGLYQVGSFPSWNRWAEWNGRYRDDLRSFLKGDSGKAEAAAIRISGSQDLYPVDARGHGASVNFLNCHDGFTLYDMYAYNEKHNEENAWDNTDGHNDNLSWNCGEEGESTNPEVLKLRRKMIRNAAAVLMVSRGTPMFFMGDEFGNSQKGNNNSYCQDNKISWLNWEDLKKNNGIFQFFCKMIRFRKDHLVLRNTCAPCSVGFPEISWHDTKPWTKGFPHDGHYVGVMFAGRKPDGSEDDIVYVAVNSYWEDLKVTLPSFPSLNMMQWVCAIDTEKEEQGVEEHCRPNLPVTVKARSVRIFYAASMVEII